MEIRVLLAMADHKYPKALVTQVDEIWALQDRSCCTDESRAGFCGCHLGRQAASSLVIFYVSKTTSRAAHSWSTPSVFFLISHQIQALAAPQEP
jgi:hypothetical protein